MIPLKYATIRKKLTNAAASNRSKRKFECALETCTNTECRVDVRGPTVGETTAKATRDPKHQRVTRAVAR